MWRKDPDLIRGWHSSQDSCHRYLIEEIIWLVDDRLVDDLWRFSGKIFCNVFLCIVDIFIVAAKQTSPKQQLDKLYLHGLGFCKLPFWTASNRPLFFIQSHRLVSIHTFFIHIDWLLLIFFFYCFLWRLSTKSSLKKRKDSAQ